MPWTTIQHPFKWDRYHTNSQFTQFGSQEPNSVVVFYPFFSPSTPGSDCLHSCHKSHWRSTIEFVFWFMFCEQLVAMPWTVVSPSHMQLNPKNHPPAPCLPSRPLLRALWVSSGDKGRTPPCELDALFASWAGPLAHPLANHPLAQPLLKI